MTPPPGLHRPWGPRRRRTAAPPPARPPARRVISDCHPSEGASKIRTQITIIHRVYFFSALPSLGRKSDMTLPARPRRAAARCERERCQGGPKDASWPVHSCGNIAINGWIWPNFWADTGYFSPGRPGVLDGIGAGDAAGAEDLGLHLIVTSQCSLTAL